MGTNAITPIGSSRAISLGRMLSRLLLYSIGPVLVSIIYWAAVSNEQPWLGLWKSSLPSRAQAAFANGQWTESAQLYRKVVKKSPDDGKGQFCLAFSLHAAGRLDEAIVEHQRAAQFDGFRPMALYNLACALALQGRRDESIAALRQSLDAGFRSQRPIPDDPDFRNLLGNAEFTELVQQQGLTLGSSVGTPAD